MPEFLSLGMTKTVDENTIDTNGYWLRPTNVGQLDEILSDASFFAYITSDTGATLERASDGLRVSSAALGLGLVGGGSELIKYSHANIATGDQAAGDTIAVGKPNGDVVKVPYLDDGSVSLAALAQDAINYIDSSGGGGTGGVPNDNSVSTVKIQDGAVTLPKLAQEVITFIDSQDVRVPDDNSVSTDKLQDGSVTVTKLNADVISYIDSKDVRIPNDDSVSTVKIQDDAVTSDKLAEDAVLLINLAQETVDYINAQGGGGGYEGFYDLGTFSGNVPVPFDVYKYNRFELNGAGAVVPATPVVGCYKLMVKTNGHDLDWSVFGLEFDPTTSDLDWTLVELSYSPENIWSLH